MSDNERRIGGSEFGSEGIYKTKDEIIDKIDEFFDAMPETIQVRNRQGERVPGDNMTQSALARHLGFKTKRSMDASLRGRDWNDVRNYYRDRFIEYWTVAAMVGDNPTFPKYMLGCYGVSDNPLNQRQHLNFDEAETEVQKAARVLMAGAKGEIEPSVVSSFIQSIKATADIKKTSELEDMVNELAQIAGIKS